MTNKVKMTISAGFTLVGIVILGIILQVYTPNYMEYYGETTNGKSIHLASVKVYPKNSGKGMVVDTPLTNGDVKVDSEMQVRYLATNVAYDATAGHLDQMTVKSKPIDRGTKTIDNTYRNIDYKKDGSMQVVVIPHVAQPEKSLLQKYTEGTIKGGSN